MDNRILVVDDEKLIVKGLRFSLEQDGMEVDCAYDGKEAVELARQHEYDVVLLDVMLPVYDGFEVCQQIREFSDMPIIMLTAKGEDMDKILGLDMGADDYITKPFNILEVKARIKAIIRRSSKRKKEAEPRNILKVKNLTMDKESRRVFINDQDGEGVRSSGASDRQSGPGLQPRKASEPGLGLRLSGRRADGGRACKATA